MQKKIEPLLTSRFHLVICNISLINGASILERSFNLNMKSYDKIHK